MFPIGSSRAPLVSRRRRFPREMVAAEKSLIFCSHIRKRRRERAGTGC
jgi:hypothetical protein